MIVRDDLPETPEWTLPARETTASEDHISRGEN